MLIVLSLYRCSSSAYIVGAMESSVWTILCNGGVLASETLLDSLPGACQ